MRRGRVDDDAERHLYWRAALLNQLAQRCSVRLRRDGTRYEKRATLSRERRKPDIRKARIGSDLRSHRLNVPLCASHVGALPAAGRERIIDFHRDRNDRHV